VRVPPELNADKVLNNIRETVKSFLKNKSNVSIELEVADQIDACLMSADSMLARSFSWAIRRLRRTNPFFLKKTGTSDMNLLASRIQIPMIAYGPGEPSLDHTTEEEVAIEDYLTAIEIYEKALERLGVLHNERDMRITS
jgi:LysW-gamma-L-lysine carboxypeptidase